jgi:DNA-binding MarR family transcriptional regulator
MSDLAYQANSSLSRLSHLISRLEKRGWVTKRPCENARRASTVVLTMPGEKKIRSAAPGHAHLVRELVVEPLSPVQLQELGEAAATIVQAIDTANRASKLSDAYSPGPPPAAPMSRMMYASAAMSFCLSLDVVYRRHSMATIARPRRS